VSGAEPFGVYVEFEGAQVVFSVHGEVDLVTAPELGALLGSVMDRDHRSLVLDLSGCDFMDASGLRVIAGAQGRLGLAGDILEIRSPSALVARILDITGLAKLVHLELLEPVAGHLGKEQPTGVPGIPVGTEAGWRRRKVTALPADDDVVDGVLRLVVALAHATVGGADGVSVSLRRHGRLATVAASDRTISDMDADQYATGEGPCVDASVHGRWFHVEDLEGETRWPAFTPLARALGINAILSSPLTARDKPVGALNIYSRAKAAFGPKDQELAAVFASEASSILAFAGLDVSDDDMARRLQDVQRTRHVIALAQGAIMQRDGVDETSAYTQLREFSQRTSRPLSKRAEDVVASTRRSDQGSPGGQDGARDA